MKDIALKHPILTFLLADSLIAGVCKTIKFIACAITGTSMEETTTCTKEENADEPSGDIH